MKKTASFFVAFFASYLSFSQNVEPPQPKDKPLVQFGLKAGLNVANMETDLYQNRDARLSFHAGGLAHIHLNPHLALQPEIMYSGQGYKQHISSGLDVTLKAGYVNLPVLIQYMYNGLRLETGPQVGFLVNAEAEYTDNRPDEDVKSYLKSTDFSWSFGSSYLTPAGIGISARYNLGISNINEKLSAPGITNSDINNRVWQFGLFYQFP